ncbi:vWA domain-containing protein [Crocosphaera sp. Alani8]|uniref:vWA domain-containing protein n=1 Tax=Crocosphaera sp. Alani8 TaxID=3038952 RepID=UPI00313A8DAE
MPVGFPEFVENPENRCPVVLLLDTSGSMSGQPIRELNEGLKAFKSSLMQDTLASQRVELEIITFGETVTTIQEFVTIDDFDPPELKTSGRTPMGQAIITALDSIEKRKAIYKNNDIQYYRPWVFLITDGAPTDSWQRAASELKDAEADKKLVFFAVGVEGADFNTLKEIASARPPLQLKGLDFREMFVWLSTSVQQVSTGKIGDVKSLPPVGWGEVPT